MAGSGIQHSVNCIGTLSFPLARAGGACVCVVGRAACGFIYRSQLSPNGTFTSPNYPGFYPRNTECHYLFYGMDNERVHITFRHFDVEGMTRSVSETGHLLSPRTSAPWLWLGFRVTESDFRVRVTVIMPRRRKGGIKRYIAIRPSVRLPVPWRSCLMGLLQLRYEHDSSTIRLRFERDTTSYEELCAFEQ